MSILYSFGVYRIRNRTNGWVYVGSTVVSFTKRWSDHLRALRSCEHTNTQLQADWDRDGENAFAFEILEVCERAIDARAVELIAIRRAAAESNGMVYNKFSRDALNAPEQAGEPVEEPTSYTAADLDFLTSSDSAVSDNSAMLRRTTAILNDLGMGDDRTAMVRLLAAQGATIDQITAAVRMRKERVCAIVRQVRQAGNAEESPDSEV